MRIKCCGILDFSMRLNCNLFACSSFRVDKISMAFAIFNILLDIGILICSFVNFGTYSHGSNSAVFWVSIGNAIVNAVASAFVIYGYFKRNPGFYLPYIMNNAIVSIVLCFFIVQWYLAEPNSFGLAFLIMILPLFVFLSYPIHWSFYKLLNDDLQERLGSIKETTSDSTIQQGQQLMQQQPTPLDTAPVEFPSHAEFELPLQLPCRSPLVHQFGNNTAAEQASLHESMADYKVI